MPAQGHDHAPPGPLAHLQVRSNYQGRLAVPHVARMCPGTQPEQLLALCQAYPFVLLLDRPDGLQVRSRQPCAASHVPALPPCWCCGLLQLQHSWQSYDAASHTRNAWQVCMAVCIHPPQQQQ